MCACCLGGVGGRETADSRRCACRCGRARTGLRAGRVLVVLDKEDHWLSRGSTRLQMLKAAMDFVERNDPP